MSVTSASETEEGSRVNAVTAADEVAPDPRVLLDRLNRATTRIRRFFLLTFAMGVGWIALKSLVILDDALRNNIPLRLSLSGLTLVVLGVLAFAYLRLRVTQSHADQEEILREMLALSERDPHRLEHSAEQLKRLSHWWSPTSKDNHLIARQIFERIEQARGSERSLPIAHEAPTDAGDTLPRSV